MADEEVITADPGDGAGVSSPPLKDPSQTPQGAGEGQDPGQTPPVDGSDSPSASSPGHQGRPSNTGWAQQRVMEKKLKSLLAEALGPITQRLDGLSKPPEPAAPASPAEEKLDYNDLPGSIQKIVEKRVQFALDKFSKDNLSNLDQKLESTAAVREARNFLWNQPEIGNDPEKVEEIKAIMRENKLDIIAAHSDPVWAIKRGFELWKQSRVNPKAPPKDTLTSITGGAGGGGGKGKASVSELMKLQKIVMDPTTSKEDMEKASARISELAQAPI